MKISTRERDGVTILDLKGKITIGVGDIALRDAIHAAVDGGAKQILLNAAGVKTIDSSGIGELVAAFTTVTKAGGALKLYGIPPKVGDILQITQLVTVLDIMDTEDEAVASF